MMSGVSAVILISNRPLRTSTPSERICSKRVAVGAEAGSAADAAHDISAIVNVSANALSRFTAILTSAPESL
jgi:hypothetical protein